MSCESLQQQPSPLNVSFGSLPEGFCPESMQALGEAIAGRLIVTPVQAFSSFAVGSIPPTSNQGPWLKDCEEWFVWDDALGMYVPIRKQGFSDQQYFESSATFVVPEFIYRLRITAIGAGGGGQDSQAAHGNGGGGGGFATKLHDVTPGESIVMAIGTGGMNGTPGGTPGGDTTVSDDGGVVVTAFGGGVTAGPSNGTQSVGGNATGGDINLQGGGGSAAYGAPTEGGNAGGWGGSGGTYGDNVAFRNGIAPGGGGAGGTQGSPGGAGGGIGGNGAVLIEW